ncbi:peptidylprolyl isomerase [Piscinibacter sp. HJYY11]|uniref:peptidylprolyl isomerase n=1 Tax=Piscinibacter sp. HJYY11 TaxID=2801333 RepID=UPI00191CA71D|nr:peptidylprolyl isomerase [Piscinibacter sp. HJYY11]MBL0730244.1 peptidylprolyl isomerase [Piscinibacter sp. HJYY11]
MNTTLALCLCASALALALPQPSRAAEPALPPGAVALVNGQPVSRALLDELARARNARSPQDRARLLDDLVNAEIASQRAQASGVAARPQVRAEVELARKTLLGQQLLRRMVAEMQIDDSTLQARYRQLQPELQIDSDHILVKDETEARHLIAQLQRGAKFASLARKHSIDVETRDRGGALGALPATELAAPYAKAAQALQPGQVAKEPVNTEFGWHVIRLNAQRTIEKQPFEALKAALHTEIATERLQAQLTQWKKEAKLTVLKAP